MKTNTPTKPEDKPKKVAAPEQKIALDVRITRVLEFRELCNTWDRIQHLVAVRPSIKEPLARLQKDIQTRLNEMEQEILSWKWPE